MIKIYIGPNGYGKTTQLQKEYNDLAKSGIDKSELLFVPSEILFDDEIKDTKDTSFTMEYIVSELLSTTAIENAKNNLQNEIDKEISDAKTRIDLIMKDVLSINKNAPTSDLIEPSSLTIKNQVKINKTDITGKAGLMGSGQKMQLILALVKDQSKKNYIFLDEPEKYSHPSLLNKTAGIINEIARSKNVYIATHSPKLLSMLDFKFSDLYIMNNATYLPRQIDFSTVTKFKFIGSLDEEYKKFYDQTTIETCIFKRFRRNFIEALFTKKIYLVEGLLDEAFSNYSMQYFDGYYDDYVIFKTAGKFLMPVFAELFHQIGIDIVCIFDEDNSSNSPHKEMNEYLISLSKYYMFRDNIESELGYTKKIKNEKSNTVAFIDFLEDKYKTLDPKYDFHSI